MQLSNGPSGFMSRCLSLSRYHFFLCFVYIPVITTSYANKFWGMHSKHICTPDLGAEILFHVTPISWIFDHHPCSLLPQTSHLMGSISKPTILTLHGRGLKLDTRDDIEQHLKDVGPAIIEEIHLNGNTIGVDASKALAEFLSKTRVLKVTLYSR